MAAPAWTKIGGTETDALLARGGVLVWRGEESGGAPERRHPVGRALTGTFDRR